MLRIILHLSYLSYNSESAVRLDYQILLKSSPLTLLIGPALIWLQNSKVTLITIQCLLIFRLNWTWGF